MESRLSPEQAAREATLRELGEAMVAIEAAAGRVRRAAATRFVRASIRARPVRRLELARPPWLRGKLVATG